ncbi:hypothetical protein TI04_06300, partial [Achromatium sp. WMS2]
AALGLTLAWLYAALAGFTTPTARSLIMLALAQIALLTCRKIRLINVFLAAFFLILILEPLRLIHAAVTKANAINIHLLVTAKLVFPQSYPCQTLLNYDQCN